MTEYEQELERLESKRCPDCHGSGSIDDAGLGDISYNTFVCPMCKGTGLIPDEKSSSGMG